MFSRLRSLLAVTGSVTGPNREPPAGEQGAYLSTRYSAPPHRLQSQLDRCCITLGGRLIRSSAPEATGELVLAIVIKKKPQLKRKAGTRAGLTKAVIAAAAAKQLEAGPSGFSLRGLAKALGVVPTSVRAHFGGEVSEIFDEVVKAALEGVARP